MKVTRLSVVVSRTFTVAPYQPLKIEAGAEVEIEEGDDIAAAREAALVEVRATLHEAYKQHHPAHANHPAPAAAAPPAEEQTNA